MADKSLETILSRLEDTSLDPKSKSVTANEIRDSLDSWTQSGLQSKFLARFVPTCLRILNGPPSFVSNTPEQRLRNNLLEVLHRLQLTPAEQFEPFAVQIVETLRELIKVENEDNAILCIKIVMDFQRHHSKVLADYVQPYLNLIQEIFKNTEQVVQDTFGAHPDSQPINAASSSSQFSNSPRPGSPAVNPSDSVPEQQQTRPLQKGLQSFRVLAECPVAVVSIFQVYRDIVAQNVKIFVPLIKGVLFTQAPAQEKAHADAAAKGTFHYGVAKDMKNRAAFGDFVTAQVKTMSFLAYILRIYGSQLQDFLPRLPELVVRLLRDCPKERFGTRKELLVAIRHVINFNFRKVFLKAIDDLLDERTLLGSGLTVYESLKPTAYSTLADLIHHVRDSLSVEQIRTTVRVYKQNMLCSIPGTSFQTMSAKLLMNMAESIAKLEDKQEARYFLMCILDATGDKLASMNRQYQNAVKVSARHDRQSSEVSAADFIASKENPPQWDEFDIFSTLPIKTTNPRERAMDPVSDNKFLFKNLVLGLKTVFYSLRACNPPTLAELAGSPVNWQEVACGFGAEEVQILIKLFHEGTKMFQYYECEKPPSESHLSPAEVLASHHPACTREEKDLLDSFATVFHHVDPATFHEIFHSEIPHIYEMMFSHPALLQIPQFLLASEATSPSFAGMLLQFLMSQIEDVGSSDVDKATILLRLFKLSFMAVTLFSTHNEAVLLPHVNKLVTSSIRLSTTAESPMQYFYLLRSLFRSIGGGRFEHLYHEILPLLEMLLEVLNSLIGAARSTQEQDLYVELSLTVPARLSNLLPHLSYLMKPLVLALRAGSELVSQGLRTLELCVDNLTADYLDPIMAPVIEDLMHALWDHLKPHPYNHFHAHTTMRILGKLGGRNRKFLEGPPNLKYEAFSDGRSSIELKLIGSPASSRFLAEMGIDTAIATLRAPLTKSASENATQTFHKRQAFKFITAQVKLLLGHTKPPPDFDQLVRICAEDIVEAKPEKLPAPSTLAPHDLSPVKRDQQQKTLRELLKSCMLSTSISELAEDADQLLQDICRHFTILEVGQALVDARYTHDQTAFNLNASEGPLEIDHRVVIDVIVDCLSSDNATVRDAAQKAIFMIRDSAAVIFGSRVHITKLPFFGLLLASCCHSCYKEEWFTKAGGAQGINIIATKLELGSLWFADRQLDICRALLYAAKDLPEDLSQSTRVQALDTLKIILRDCNASLTPEELLSSVSKMHSLLAFIILELAHPCRHVRAVSQEAFSILAKNAGVEVHQIVAPVKNALLNYVFGKPLRGLPFPTQIGYIDAVAFCLRLQNGILEPSEQMSRFLRETSILADQETENFPGRAIDQRQLDNTTKLKVACLRLLSLALDFPELGQSPSGRNRPRVIATFFKSLYSKQTEVVEAANQSLQSVVEKDTKLPKDILQGGLRPILVSLQDPQKLKIDNLHCLARLLQILKNYFKVEIGSRLLENSKLVVTEEILQKASFTLIEQHESVSVVAAVIHIFHLLPPSANQFMDQLVDRVLQLEHSLRRTHFSPFREPLIKFLNRYPSETWERFSSFLSNDKQKACFFAQILHDQKSQPIREAVIQNLQPLIQSLTNGRQGAEWTTETITVAQIAEALCHYPESGKVLVSDPAFRQALFDRSKKLEALLSRNEVGPAARLGAEQTAERLMRIIMFYLSHNADDFDCLFDVINAITSKDLKESSVLFNFIFHKIIEPGEVDRWRSVISRSVDIFRSRNVSEQMKAFAMRNFVSPILAKDVMRNWSTSGPGRGTELVNKNFIESFQTKLWKPQSAIDPADEKGPPNVDSARIELLQVTATLLKYYKDMVQDARKDVIKFGWTYIRLEDVMNKYAAYVVLAYFVKVFETPLKIASQIYGALMTAYSGEAKALVTQALEILAPVLTERLKNNESRSHPWAALARKPLVEDPSNVAQMMSVFQFIARHPMLFYEAKEQFAQMIIPSLTKFAGAPGQSTENKKMTLSFIQLLWIWEERFIQEENQKSPSGAKRASDGTEASRNSKPTSFIGSSSARLTLIKYLFQFTALMPDRFPTSTRRLQDSIRNRENPRGFAASSLSSSNLCKQAVDLFANFISPPYWSDLDINSMFPKITEAILTGDPKPDDKPEIVNTRIINTLQLIRVMVNAKPDSWVRERIPQLQKLIAKPIRNQRPEVQDCLFSPLEEDTVSKVPLVKRMFDCIPKQLNKVEEGAEDAMDTSDEGSELLSFLLTVASEGAGGGNVLAAVNILTMLSHSEREEIEQHLISLSKLLTAYTKEMLNSVAAQQNQMAMNQGSRPTDTLQNPSLDPATLEPQDQAVLKIIELLSRHLTLLGDHRRQFLQVLTSIIDKSPKQPLCARIMEIVSDWVFNSKDSYPTIKEKTAMLLKMANFENRPDPTLFNNFLDIVIRVYEDPRITRSELAIRLESAFLIGTRAPNIDMRNRFMNLFDRHLSRTASKRIAYLIREQSWDALADSFWISQVIQLLFGSIEMDNMTALSPSDFTTAPAARLIHNDIPETRKESLLLDEAFEGFMEKEHRFMHQMKVVRSRNLLEPLCDLQHCSSDLAKEIWSVVFPVFWSALNKDERSDLQNGLVNLTTRDFHARQLDKRPNCIQALLEGVARTNNPRMNFPHNLIKFLARMYDAWYPALCYMEESAVEPIVNTASVRESNLDALAEVYAHLVEEDLFYGLWRRRSQFLTTNTALSHEQIGDWDMAQRTYETATFKARTGEVPLSQAEYILWEDHWVFCAQKLQQWDILADFAKVDNLNDLYLDAIWRSFDKWSDLDSIKNHDSIVRSVSDAPTPRRMFFQSFMALLKVHFHLDTVPNFTRVCDEAIQLSIRKWHQLPNGITNAHIPILQNFQQMVELHEANVISNSLNGTNQQNLDAKAPELKLLLTTWRDRLPNFWDDIGAWQDLVTWRRHIFQLVNQKYLSLAPPNPNNASGNSLAFRGYHETAWMINKFAHVARKHHLSDVCMNQLSTIYTLPNIEIQEAFLKLKEQAKCHLQNTSNTSELHAGLDVIVNTNLNYFGPQQKAEFYTLKGMFLAKDNKMTDADESFGTALFFDLKLPKAWAEWARYNEQLFKESPEDISKAAAAMQCYLEAAGTYKNSKSRKAIGRILWLLSLDDQHGRLAKTFEDYKGDIPTWYWITFIPQLLSAVSRQEAKIAKAVLIKLAKTYPQALYYNLRTSREDYMVLRKQLEARLRNTRPNHGSPSQNTTSDSRPNTSGSQGNSSRPSTAPGENQVLQQDETPQQSMNESKLHGSPTSASAPADQPSQKPQESSQPPQQQQQTPQQDKELQVDQKSLQPWDHLDEVASVLKTTFPLLALSMETMVEQIGRHFRANTDEEAFRLINALLTDAFNYINISPGRYTKGSKIASSTETNIKRFSASMLSSNLRAVFEADFLHDVPDMVEYISKARKWRDRFEEIVDRRPRHVPLENMGHYLSEFEFNKFDEVEVPGQYLLHKDKNQDFIRIERFLADVELSRLATSTQKILKIRGHDGSAKSFAIQHPTSRNARREEKTMQMFRFFNDVLARRKETRRRKLQFTLPVMVSISPAVRLVQADESNVTLQGIYEDFCRRKRISRDDAILFAVGKLRDLRPQNAEQASQIRLQVFEHISTKQVPSTLVLDYFRTVYPNFGDFWLFRKQAAYQLATLSFMTYILHMRDRGPAKMAFSRHSGEITGMELVPNMSSSRPRPIFENNEAVPLRLTPNLQTFIGPLAIEGIFTASVLVIAKALAEPVPTDTKPQANAPNGDAPPSSSSGTTADSATNNQSSPPKANGNANNADGNAPTSAKPIARTPDSKLESILSIFVRDEVLMWFVNLKKPSPGGAELREYVRVNSELIVKRAFALAKAPATPGSLPASQSVIDIISKSVDPRKLSQMDGLWMPWL